MSAIRRAHKALYTFVSIAFFALSCNPPENLSSDAGLADGFSDGMVLMDGGVDAMVDGGADMGPPTVCDPDPFAPARPLWSQVDNPNNYATGPYPDYETISNNFTVLESITLLISVFTKAIEKLEKVKSADLSGQLSNLLDPNQVFGHCLCNQCGQLSPDEIWAEATEGVLELAQNTAANLPSTFAVMLNEIIQTRLDFLRLSFIETKDYILARPEQVVDNIVMTIEMQVETLLLNAQNTLTSANAGSINTTVQNYQAEMDAVYTGLKDTIIGDFDTVKATVEALLDVNNPPSITKLWADVVALWEIFKDVNQISDLTCPDNHPNDQCVDFDEVQTLISSIEGQVTQMVTLVQGAITAVTSTYNAAMEAVDQVTELTTDLTSSLQTNIENQINGTIAGVNGLQADFDTFQMNLPGTIQAEVEAGLNDILTEIQSLFDDCQQVVTGVGIGQDLQDVALNQLDTQIIGPFTDIISDALGGCYARARREGCNEYCDGNGGVFLWFPTDIFKDPSQAGAAALFALDQVGFLDEVAELTNGDSPFLDGVNAAIGALGDAASFLANIQELLAAFLEYVDRFTEGYHLGAYDTQRPDLHMCIGYAGHGAYAQMGNLGNGRVSIGARYTSHNLSKKHRAQFRSGGFAVQAFGRGLSLLPTIEINTQIDGWKWWDAQRPFGLNLGGSIPVSDIVDYDVFHLVDENQLGALSSNGQVGFGNFLIKDLYTAQYSNGVGGPHEWPRPSARDTVGWERYSTAILSAGLNLNLDMTPQRWDLPTIQIYPPLLSATPFFALAAGVAWYHDANYLLRDLRDKINEGLSGSDQLTDADFERDMHDFQAPDLSADNGTSAYVEPEVGVDVFLGFKIWKIKIGAGALLSVSVNVEPSGNGGVLDLNAALADLLMLTNTPAEAPCEPVMTTSTSKICSNKNMRDPDGNPVSQNTYACEPSSGSGSCCLRIANKLACIDGWTGIDQNLCEQINVVHDTREEAIEFLDGLPGFIPGSIINPLLSALTDPQVVNFNLFATWSAQSSCANSCPDAHYSTALVNISSISECQQYGVCTRPDGTVEYDVTEADCISETTANCIAVPPGPDAPIGSLFIGGQTETAQYVFGSQGAPTAAWEGFVMDQASAAAATHLDQGKCLSGGYCINFSYMPPADSAAAGYVSNGVWAIGNHAGYPITYVGAGGPQACQYGTDQFGNTINPMGTPSVEFTSTPSHYIPFVWQPNQQPSGQWAGYSCYTDIDETLAGWEGPGCSPLQQGFSSACGCQDDTHCMAGETCSDGRCVDNGGNAFSCVCGPGGACPNGRECRNGACTATCAMDSDCTPGRECDGGACVLPEGVPFAEEVAWGIANVTAPMHLVTSYALSAIKFLARFKASFYVEASFKLFGKKKTWRLFDFAKVWDIGSTSKAWYQPGLEARYQHECAGPIAGTGITNRFPISATTPSQTLTDDGANPHPNCAFLSGGVCRYPDNPSADWNNLPPVVQDPETFQAGNAGSLEDFIDWCKDDMPEQIQNPTPSSTDGLIDGLVDTINFGTDVGMDAWHSQQMCINGETWREFYNGLPDNIDNYQCTYTDPTDGLSYSFPCTDVTDEMLKIWGCLDVGANSLSQTLADDFPFLVTTDPTHGDILTIEQMFTPQMVDAEQPDGTIIQQLDLVYESTAMRPQYRNHVSYNPFISLVGHRWLGTVEACFDSRFESPDETACPCSNDSDCEDSAGEQCIGGECHQPQQVDPLCNADCDIDYVRKQCMIVEMELEAGPCCGDGVIQDDPGLPYVETCDDGNTESGDGCSADCQLEVPPQSQCAIGSAGQCNGQCPVGQECDQSCTVCIPDGHGAGGNGGAGGQGGAAGMGGAGGQGGAAGMGGAGGAGGMVGGLCAIDPDTNRCIDQCPEGQVCNLACDGCTPMGVDKCSPLANGECRDLCPPGTVCDPNCQGCIQDPIDCDGPDVCDGLDNDCDDQIDEDALPQGVVCGQGICARDGRRLCQGGHWIDDCQPGQPIPGPDICDSRDSDCDGEVDEDFLPNNTVCGEGICQAFGQTRCDNGQIIDSCQPGQPQGGIDDCGDGDTDCDGAVDEDCPPAGCNLDRRTGRCIDTCPDGQSCDADCSACVDDVPPSPCNLDAAGACDDQCPDGQVCDVNCAGCVDLGPDKCHEQDDGSCLDVCPDGLVCDPNCQGCIPAGNDCNGPDICDGLDNDCDQEVDEDAVNEGIVCGQGICRRDGVRRCIDGNLVDECIPGQALRGPDDCDNRDSDCDGQTDEDFGSRGTLCGVGECSSMGMTACVNGQIQDSCQPGAPGQESRECNNNDEDCDGTVDEGCVANNIPCSDAGECIRGGWCEPANRPDCWAGNAPVCHQPGTRISLLYCGGGRID